MRAQVPAKMPLDTKEMWIRQWRRFMAFVIPFGFDIAISLLVFGAFVAFSWVITFARAENAKIQQSYLDCYEQVHFWLNVALFSMVGVDFLVRVGKDIFGSIFRGE